MSSRAIAFDLTRLITRLRHASPTGIDRVDLAYARHVLSGSEPRFGIVTTSLGPRVVEREQARAIVDAVAEGWVEDAVPEHDRVYRLLIGQPGEEPGRSARRRDDSAKRMRLRLAASLRMFRGRSPKALPQGTIYLHSSHLRLDLPGRFDWLYDRRDIRPVFFVHDLIPISHPEYGRAGEAERHQFRMRSVARHAAAVIVNSADVGAHFSRHLRSRGLAVPPVTVAHLGVEPAFTARGDSPPGFSDPTFLVCGTIESRKNHLILLQVWRELAGRLGPRTPRLIVVGRRGWEAESAIDLLERCDAISPYVTEATGLSTPGLAQIMRRATALLMPSFVEGFGLPLIEAAASGLPVVASDIPVHREIAGSFAKFLDPLDGPGWRASIEELSAPHSELRRELSKRLVGYEPPNWPDHLARLDETLARLDTA